MNKKVSIYIIVFILFLNHSHGFAMYTDIQDHWSREYVQWGTEKVYLFNGYEDGTFRPDRQITIGEYISVLNRILYLQGVHNINGYIYQDLTLPYRDITRGHWAYEDIVEIMYYIDNYSKTDIKFQDIFPNDYLRPNTFITRYEASLLARAITTPPIEVLPRNYKDMNSDMPFYNEINELINNSIIFGYGDQTFRLNNNITRGEAATIIKRVYDDFKFVKEDLIKLHAMDDIISKKQSSLLFEINTRASRDTNLDNEFLDAITSLEYLAFVGHIPYEERHLYDLTPIDTLWELKNKHYNNVIGTNYYLIKYDNDLGVDRKVELIREALQHYLSLDEREVEGMYQFLQISRDYITNEEFVTITEEIFRITQEPYTKLEIGGFLIDLYLKDSRVQEALNIYEVFLDYEINLYTKAKLVANAAYFQYQSEDYEEVVEYIYNHWLQLKEHRDYVLYKEDIDYILIGFMKQLMIN